MSSVIKVDTIQSAAGSTILGQTNSTTITLGVTGQTITVPSGATLDGSNATLTGIATTNGITEADNWRVTADFTPSGQQVITSNWERVDTDADGYIGTGMTQSSGVFTFPSTGYYLVHFHGEASHTSYSQYVSLLIDLTEDNSNYSFAAEQNFHIYSTGTRSYQGGDCMKIIDVTDTSLVKVRFVVQGASSVTFRGTTSSNQTCVHFIRLGDT